MWNGHAQISDYTGYTYAWHTKYTSYPLLSHSGKHAITQIDVSDIIKEIMLNPF